MENIVAISSFVTMFSKSCLLQRRQKASIWGKGLRHLLYTRLQTLWRKDVFKSYSTIILSLLDFFCYNCLKVQNLSVLMCFVVKMFFCWKCYFVSSVLLIRISFQTLKHKPLPLYTHNLTVSHLHQICSRRLLLKHLVKKD